MPGSSVGRREFVERSALMTAMLSSGSLGMVAGCARADDPAWPGAVLQPDQGELPVSFVQTALKYGVVFRDP
jgi:hypothetical protein